MAVKRAFSYEDIQRKKFKLLDFTGQWLKHIGKPERSGAWTIYGYSGHGKTSYEMQLAKFLCSFERVHINSLEEGMRQSFKDALNRYNMDAVKSKWTFQKETYEELWERLDRKRQPKVVFIDSLQYFFRGKRIKHFFDLIEKFPDTLFVFIAHANPNGSIKGKLAEDVLYHSDVKVSVVDFLATVITRYDGGGEPFVVFEKGYTERRLKLTGSFKQITKENNLKNAE